MARKHSQAWHTERRQRVKTAVGLQALTLREYAATVGVTHTHLNYVLRGVRTSDRLNHEFWRMIRWAFGPTIAHTFHPTNR